MTTTAPDAPQRLRAAGLRVTAPRLAVLDVLTEHPHADAATILEETRERTSGVSVQGVYDVLAALTRARVLRRIQPANSVARYEVDHGDNHHHAVCRSCGQFVDVPCALSSAPCVDPSGAQEVGFAIDEAEVIYWGMCPSCRTSETVAPAATPSNQSHQSTHP